MFGPLDIAQSGGDEERSNAKAESMVPSPQTQGARLRQMMDQHFDFVWRQLRRLGVREDRADDAAQQVFIVVSRKLDSILPVDERSFVFGTLLRVASDFRRAAAREQRATLESAGALDPQPGADELLDRQRRRAILDQILDALPPDLRVVFVLFELEEMKMTNIADLLGLAPGTVASRLRRAREEFEAAIKRRRARTAREGER